MLISDEFSTIRSARDDVTNNFDNFLLDFVITHWLSVRKCTRIVPPFCDPFAQLLVDLLRYTCIVYLIQNATLKSIHERRGKKEDMDRKHRTIARE